MPRDQTRAGEAHDLAHPLAHLGAVAVHPAVGAGRLFGAERTAREPDARVLRELGAGRAEPSAARHAAVPGTAVQHDHRLDRAPLAAQAAALEIVRLHRAGA
jgi:hypothetical protein